MTDNNLTHFDASGNAVMVDVSEKTGGKSGHYIRAEGGYV